MTNIGKSVKLGVFTLAIMNVTASYPSGDCLPKLNMESVQRSIIYSQP